ncbi:MAG TPA: hypothetical protein VGS57_05185 [Thermoanaerobaculia bacterium]|nr:hypothetical protein [Thermoanaerobaculia bacterium]
MPVSIQVGFGLTLLTSWVLFEETVIDRTRLAHIMPGYSIADACIWDGGAVVVIVALVWLLRSRRGAS